ncbi:MAG: radical SAM family heme chaperone HemW [Gammaproteobacteria bacterium]
MNQINHLNPLPISLYIHFPWCVRKCPYCDFNSHALKTGGNNSSSNNSSSIPEKAYIDSLIHDFTQNLEYFQGRSIHSIFMGGGTPSLFSGSALGYLLEKIQKLVPMRPGAEITLEANPGRIEHDSFKAYAQAGINRISIGAQSFNPQHLKTLGRIHDTQHIYKAVQELQNAGISNFNLDLMFGLPQQNLEEALDDLEQAIALGPHHISWYQLTLEPNTPFYYKPPKHLPDEDSLMELQTAGQELLKNNGFLQYEVSAYAKDSPQFQSQHNLNYWQFGDYLGIGAGAHSKITLFNDINPKIIRFSKEKFPNQYMAAAEKNLNYPVDDLVFEFLMNSLRLKSGLLIQDFCNRTFETKDDLFRRIQPFIKKELLEFKPEKQSIQATDLGFIFLDSILSQL